MQKYTIRISSEIIMSCYWAELANYTCYSYVEKYSVLEEVAKTNPLSLSTQHRTAGYETTHGLVCVHEWTEPPHGNRRLHDSNGTVKRPTLNKTVHAWQWCDGGGLSKRSCGVATARWIARSNDKRAHAIITRPFPPKGLHGYEAKHVNASFNQGSIIEIFKMS